MTLEKDKIITFERTFTKKDVELFSEISGDEGEHHQTGDEVGRFVVQGLLTATLPTKIGGDYNVLARSMHFEFLRPVYTGDTVRCEATIDEYYQDEKNRMKIASSFTCTDHDGKKVMKGNFNGVIL